MQLPPTLIPLLNHLTHRGMTPIIVGGYIRDSLLDRHAKDIDIEVYDSQGLDALKTELSKFGTLHEVGSSFGVLKIELETLQLDISLPRTESKIAPGHQGFCVDTTRKLNFSEAARRRDFTINAMGYNTVTNTLLDPYGGQEDLRQGILREVDADTFVEDPLRLYRTMQFAARFSLRVSDSLHRLCTTMVDSDELSSLPKARIFEEFQKLLLKSDTPSLGIHLLKTFGALRYFDALNHLASKPCHSQKNLFDHTLLTLDTMASRRSGNIPKDLIMMLAILCHKMPQYGSTFLDQLTESHKLIDAVTTLVRYNRYPQKLYDLQAGEPEVLALSAKVCIADLIQIAETIDMKCHRHLPQHRFQAGEWLRKSAEKLHVYHKAPQPLLQGRDLIAENLKPSKAFKQILDDAYRAQLQQEFTCKSEARQWLRTYLTR